jgi:hypothetical protein
MAVGYTYFMTIWYDCGRLVYWYAVPRKIWQPWFIYVWTVYSNLPSVVDLINQGAFKNPGKIFLQRSYTDVFYFIVILSASFC